MNGVPSHKTLQIFLGCSESQLKSGNGFLSGADVMSLQFHTGHLLAHPDRDFRDYQLNLILGEGSEQAFTFSESDRKGTELVPSVFWLNGRERQGLSFNALDTWSPTHWEQQQFSSPPCAKTSEGRPMSLSWDFTLSPATLKTYISCPFRFFAEKGLKLVDPAIVDLDIDPRTLGTLQHHLLELLVQEPFEAASLRSQLPQIIVKVIAAQADMFFSEQTKAIFAAQLEELGSRFLDHEENYRKDFPHFRTLAREAWFRKDLIIAGRKVGFRGKIDRLDISADQKQAIVIDYKMDVGKYHNASSWLAHLEYQLPAYVDSVETGAVEIEAEEPGTEKKRLRTKLTGTPVIAAHYYGVKDFTRKGFTLDEPPAGIVSKPSKNSGLSEDDKKMLLKQFNEILQNTTSRIAEGEFPATPHPSTDCKKCPWRNLCRAPKQNL
jgi:ATP-dependent helicase/DNAse subunit B